MRKIDIIIKAIDITKSNGYVCPFELNYETGLVMDRKIYNAIIFDVAFCKALWGEEEKFMPYLYTHPHIGERVSLWKWHLRQMVVCDDPMEYLERNLDKDSWDKVYGKEELEKLEQYKEKLANLIGNISEADVPFFSDEWVKKNILYTK